MAQFKKVLREWIIPYGLEIIIVVLLIKYVFFFVTVPTGSMLPTISERAWLFATRMYAPEKTVQHDDVIVFDSEETGQLLIKRAIGLPGDTIVLTEDGTTTRNGEVLPEEYVVYPGGEIGAFTVPDGHYLFIGDNRAASFDARYWQQPYIPADALVGEARFSFWPLNNLRVF